MSNDTPGLVETSANLDSKLLAVVRSVHTRVLGSEPHVGAIHAGLEGGLIGEMVRGAVLRSAD